MAGEGRFGEREEQKDVWPQTQAVEGERKCKGEDERLGIKMLEGRERDLDRAEMEVCSGEKEDEK